MTLRQTPRELRRAPRVEVRTRVRGELTEIGAPITICNLSRSGFAVLSEVAFERGQRLDFQLSSADGLTISVSAEAVHHRPVPKMPGHHLTGFKFVPGRLLNVVPQAMIDRLIDAVSPVGSLL